MKNSYQDKIVQILLEESYKTYRAKRKHLVDLADMDAANQLVNDLDKNPHAFVIACILDRQISAERAWSAPYVLKQRLNGFDFTYLESLSKQQIYNAMTRPIPIHRFNKDMSFYIFSGIQRIKNSYESNDANIWNDIPSSSLLVYRFLQFEGIGNKIATMASNILVRDFKIKVSDKYSIDISVDVQVKRVFKRLGLVNKDASNEEIIFRARSLHPKYPGIFDLECWNIGREWCRPKKPLCSKCYLNDLCPKINVN